MDTTSSIRHVVDALTVLWDEGAKVSTPMWTFTEPMARAVLSSVESLPGLAPHLRAFRKAPLHPLSRRALTVALAEADLRDVVPVVEAFASNGAVFPELGELYHEPHPPPVLSEPAHRTPLPVDTGEWDITVVVDFRAAAGQDGRSRNAVACLRSLADQTFARRRFRVVVIEQDAVPRHADTVSRLADDYAHLRYDGPYNRSWAHNVGAARASGRGRFLAFLDADMLLEKDFLERAWHAVTDAGASALLPYDRVVYLNHVSSDRAIAQRLGTGGTLDPRRLHGYHLTPTMGGCLFVASALFEELAGYDERFEGWGEEDNEFFYRVEAAVPVPRLDVDLHHLDHERPAMPVRAVDHADRVLAAQPSSTGIGDERRYSKGSR